MAQLSTDDGLPSSLVSTSVLPALVEDMPVFKVPAQPEKRKHTGGIASKKEMESLEPSLPSVTIKLDQIEGAKTNGELIERAGGIACKKEMQALEHPIPPETMQQESMEGTGNNSQESLIPAALIKVEPMDYEEVQEVLPDEFVTSDILNVEKKLKKQLDKERKRMEKQMSLRAKINTVTEVELRNAQYNRLMHLFETSNFYSNFMQENLKNSDIDKTKNKYNKKKGTNGDTVKSKETCESTNKQTSGSSLTLPDPCNASEVMDVDKKTTKQDRNNEVSQIDKEDRSEGDSYVNAMGFTVPRLQPKLFEGGVMREYQVDGLEWLRILDVNSVSGILADEMGLGKTIQVIALICHLIGHGIPGPFLIIAPLSTIPNWMTEFQRFAPKIPTLLLHGNVSTRQRLIHKFGKQRQVAGTMGVHPVVVTSFQIPLAEKTFFRGKAWRYLVVDEGHAIKNHQTQLAVELKRLSSVTRLIVTGTPLQNNLAELWSLLNFLLPEVFNDLSLFETWFNCKDLLVKGGEDKILAQEQEKHILSTMHQILSPFLLRRLKSDVELDLPPKKERLVFCPLTPTQKQLYSAVLDKSIDMMLGKQVKKPPGPKGRPKRRCVEKRSGKSYSEAIVIDSDSDSDLESWTSPDNDHLTITDVQDPKYKLRIRMQQPLTALRLIVNHPYLVQMPLERERRSGKMNVRIDEDLVKKSGKMLVLDAILAKLKQNGHKVLIFSSFTMMLDLLADFMDLRGYDYCHLDGRVPLAKRQKQIQKFNTEPETFVFLISTRAGGLGINLTAADTVITFDSDWNPQADLQAQDRCHRIGQTRPVVVYRLATEGTVDQVIIERAAAKRKLEKMIIQKNVYNVDRKLNKTQTVDLVALRTLLQSDDFEVELHSNGYAFNDQELEALLDRSSMLKKKKKKTKLPNEIAE